jgi:LPS-assembly lipoprotein
MTRRPAQTGSKAGLCPDPPKASAFGNHYFDETASRRPPSDEVRGPFPRACGLALLAALLLAGCGFHPLYDADGARAQSQGGTVSAHLDGIYVELIPNRAGQLLRQALQTRLDSDDGDRKAYSLAVSYSIAEEAISVLNTNSNTRTRAVGRGTWSLTAIANPGTPLASGTVRVLDGFNTLDEQVFFSVLENEAVQRRLADNIADQITQRLATYFRRST